MTAAEWQVGDLGQPTPPPEGAGTEATPPPDAGGPTSADLPSGWTSEDVQRLEAIVRGPYDKLAEITGDPAYRLSDVDVLMLVGSLTTWMPVSWVRAGPRGQLPLVIALPISAVAIVAVNLPKLALWNRTHPDAAISLPFVGRKGTRGDRSRTTQARDAGDARRDQPDGRSADRDGAAGDAPAEPAAARVADGGPAADSVSDIQRGYEARR